MRGTTRIQVEVLLALSGVTTGALVGFATGLLPIPELGAAALAIAVVAAALDALRVPPPSVRRQVPAYWGRIFDPRLTAALYGARLGVGPLTILPTWLWWAATVIGASHGPWASALTGAAFATSRAATMLLAGARARALDRFDRGLRIGVAVAILAIALAACSDGDGDGAGKIAGEPPELELEPSTTTTTTPEDTALADLLLDDPGPGFELVRDEVMDLDAAAEAEADVEAERALLETRGFERGWTRTWESGTGAIVFVTAYDLASQQQAELYLLDGVETLTARDADRFEVPDVPGAFGFTTVENAFTAHAVAFTSGPRWFLVLVGSADGSRTPDEARALAAVQAARA